MQAVRSVRPAQGEYDEYYDKYIRRVPDGDITETLVRQVVATIEPLRALDDARANHAYAAGKWSVKEVIGHLCDAERVFAHRALRFARSDTTPLPGFDENAYVPAGQFGERSLNDLLDELLAVRAATVALFRHLPRAAWTRTGSANGVAVSVRALAWIAAGHELHHRALLEERYAIPMGLGAMPGPA